MASTGPSGSQVAVIHEGRTNFSELHAALPAGRQERLIYYAFDVHGVTATYAGFPRLSANRRRLTCFAKMILNSLSSTLST
jgi:hypothetical protein